MALAECYCLDVSVSRQGPVWAEAPAAGSVLSLWHWRECLQVRALNILSRFDLQDCMCIMQTWPARVPFSTLPLSPSLSLSLSLSLSMTASVNRPQQTIPDASSPLLPVPSLFTFPPCCSPSSFLSPFLPLPLYLSPPAGPLPQPYLAPLCQTDTTVQRQQPHPWSMSSVWCSPQDWDKQSFPVPAPSHTPALPAFSISWCTQGEMGRGGEKGGEGEEESPTNTTSASPPPSLHPPAPPPPPPTHTHTHTHTHTPHPSSLHSHGEDGFTFCPGFQALRHRWVPAAARPQWRRAQAGWERTARRGSRGGTRVQPLRQWKETAAGWAPLHNLLS